MVYVLMKRAVQASIKRQKHQTSVKNVMFMSAKTFSRDIITIVNQKANRLYYIFAIKGAFSSFYFQSFSVHILPVIKPVAFTWCEEWVIAGQTILW